LRASNHAEFSSNYSGIGDDRDKLGERAQTHRDRHSGKRSAPDWLPRDSG
jgi:hypothetical protein